MLVVSIAFDWVLAAAVAVEAVVLHVGKSRSRRGSCVFARVQRSVLTIVFTFMEIACQFNQLLMTWIQPITELI